MSTRRTCSTIGKAHSRRAFHGLVRTVPTALVLCLTAAIALGGLAQPVMAQEPAGPELAAITRCEPEWAYTDTAHQAQVCIYVQDVVGLYGADFEMTFPGMVGVASVVDEDSVTPGVQILPDSTFMSPPWVVYFNTADNSTGYLHYLVYLITQPSGRTGSGPIACMRFQPSGQGNFYVNFARHDLSDQNGFLIDNTARTCRVTFVEPTGVTLERFEGWPVRRSIHLQWETAQEVDNAGFNVYRSRHAIGGYRKLNTELIPTLVPPGSPFGAVYDFVDTRVRRGITYYYMLEDVNIRGHRTRHGPVEITMPALGADQAPNDAR